MSRHRFDGRVFEAVDRDWWPGLAIGAAGMLALLIGLWRWVIHGEWLAAAILCPLGLAAPVLVIVVLDRRK